MAARIYIRNASPLATKHAQKKQEKREPMTFLHSKLASVHSDKLTSCSYVTEEKKIQHTKTKIKPTKEEGEPPKRKQGKERTPTCMQLSSNMVNVTLSTVSEDYIAALVTPVQDKEYAIKWTQLLLIVHAVHSLNKHSGELRRRLAIPLREEKALATCTRSLVNASVECCFTSTETVGLLGTGAQDGHLDFHKAPELRGRVRFTLLYVHRDRGDN